MNVFCFYFKCDIIIAVKISQEGNTMKNDAFTEGIAPSGLRNRSEIGILICYILDYIGKPFPKDDLIGLIQENGFANYFETTSAVSELIKNKNIEYSDETGRNLSITKNGKLIASQLNSSLSLIIRHRATSATANLLLKKKIEHENPVSIARAEGGGYNVNLRITDGIRDLMSLTLFVPDIKEANAVKRNFHKNPERLYSVVLAAVIGDKDIVKSALEELL